MQPLNFISFFAISLGEGESKSVNILTLFLIMRIFSFAILSLLIAGCAVQSLTPAERKALNRKSTDAITAALIALSPSPKSLAVFPETVREEASAIAAILVRETEAINRDFRMTTTPNWHNVLIKLGKRRKGYCYHWTEELLKRLPPYPLKAFERHWGVAYKKLDENNAVILTRRGAPLETGIVYDAWRGSGRPFWLPVTKDKKYSWQRRFREEEILIGKAGVEPK